MPPPTLARGTALASPTYRWLFPASPTRPCPCALLSRSLVETFKLALVQYIALFLPVAAVLHWLYAALFRFGIVASRVHHPIKQHAF